MDSQWHLLALAATELSTAVFALVMWIVPSLGRPDVLFWVPTSQDFSRSEEAGQIVRRYRRRVLVLAVFGLVLAGVIAVLRGFWAILFADLLMVPGFFCILSRARQDVLPHQVEPSGQRSAPIRPRRKRLPGGLAGQAIPTLILFGAAAWLWTKWASMPARIPLDKRGPDVHLVLKSPIYFTFFFLFFLGMSVVIAFINYGLVYRSRPICVDGELGRLASAASRTVLTMATAANYVSAGIGAFFLINYAVPPSEKKLAMNVFYGIFGLGLLTLFVALVVYVRKWLRLRAAEKAVVASGGTLPTGPESDEANWRCGHTFYCDTEDPALWVQDPTFKRWTLNFSRRGAWVFVGLLCISLVFLVSAVSMIVILQSNQLP